MKRSIYMLAEVAYKFIALNFLWLFFCVLGLGVFGFMPATVALFRVTRKWIHGEANLHLGRDFFTFYKAEFIRSNIIGLMFAVVFYIIYVNFSFVSYFYNEAIHLYIYIVIASIATLIMMAFVNLFSVMAHFEGSILRYVKMTIGFVIAHPFLVIMQIVWLVAYALVWIHFPKVSIVIGVSVLAYILMSMNAKVFQRYELQKA